MRRFCGFWSVALALVRPLETLSVAGAPKLNGFDESTLLPAASNENDGPKSINSSHINIFSHAVVMEMF